VDFLVEFEIDVPAGTPESEVEDRERAEAVAATKLGDEGHLLRLDDRHRRPARAPSQRPSGREPVMTVHLPKPRLSLVYRLEAQLGEPLDLGGTPLGRRRIVPQTAGAFRGPEISGRLLPGASADWQTVLPDGTALADIRYTLQTDSGDLLYVRSQGVRQPDQRSRSPLGPSVRPIRARW
jgi:uncharacterized protein DUF3237